MHEFNAIYLLAYILKYTILQIMCNSRNENGSKQIASNNKKYDLKYALNTFLLYDEKSPAFSCRAFGT